jgi:transcriptional regulator with XRE-family HTH domain
VKRKRPIIRRASRPGEDYAVFVELLATVRREKEITQTDLGERVGRRQTWVAKVEAGDRRIDAVELLAVLDALKVDFVEFFTRLRRELRKTARRPSSR